MFVIVVRRGKRAIELYHYQINMIIATPPGKIANNKSTSAHPSGQIVDPTFFDAVLRTKVISLASPGFMAFQISPKSFGYPHIFLSENGILCVLLVGRRFGRHASVTLGTQ